MSMWTDDQIINMILQHEGSAYTNHPLDAGGPTRWGITQAVLAAWRGHAVTPDDVKNLTRDEADAIYRAQHLRPFDGLRDVDDLRVNVIDMSVHAGVRRAILLLQELVGAVVDGWVGPETIGKAHDLPEGSASPLYTGFRLSFYEGLIVAKPAQKIWRTGWRNRALSFITPAATKAAPTAAASRQMAKAAPLLMAA
jgi:lysozyme family protein